MARLIALTSLLLLAGISLSACASRSDGGSSAPTASASAVRVPPADSPLAGVAIGMNDAQVRKLMGEPDDATAYMTGKMFIPFYFGPDTHRADWIYQRQGRVVFSRNRWTGGLKVISVIYEPGQTVER